MYMSENIKFFSFYKYVVVYLKMPHIFLNLNLFNEVVKATSILKLMHKQI